MSQIIAAAAPPPTNRRALLPWYVCHFSVVFCYSIITNAIYTLSIYRLKEPVASTLWVAAGGGLIYTLSAFFSGRMVERFGSKRILLYSTAACVLVCLSAYIAAASNVFIMMSVSIWLLNLLATPSWPAIESALSRSPGTLRLGTRMMFYNLSWSTSSFVAFFLTGALGEWLGWRHLFLILGLCVIGVWFLMAGWTIPQSMILKEHVEDHSEKTATVAPMKAATLLILAWVANLFAYVCANSLVPLMPAITLGLGIASTGLATAIGSVWLLARVLGFYLSWLWTGWRYRIRWKLAFFIILVLSTFFLIISQTVSELILLEIVFGLAAAMIYSGSLYYAMHLSRGSGKNAGIHEAVIGVGTVLGPAIAAMSGSAGSLAPKALAILILQGGGLGIMLVLAYRLKLRMKPVAAKAS